MKSDADAIEQTLLTLFEIYATGGGIVAATAVRILSGLLSTAVTLADLRCDSPVQLLACEDFVSLGASLAESNGRSGARLRSLFDRIAGEDNATYVSKGQLVQLCERAGLRLPDPRLPGIEPCSAEESEERLLPHEFLDLVHAGIGFLERVSIDDLAIPKFSHFATLLEDVYESVADRQDGENAGYIPALRDAPSDRWGVSVCTVDGQRHSIGDTDERVSVQSTTKVVQYLMAQHHYGYEGVLERVGVEPSGQAFNSPALLPDGRAFNPMVNSGAIMTASLLAAHYDQHDPEEIAGLIGEVWASLAGLPKVELSRETMLAEKSCANTNYSLAYLLNAGIGLPSSVERACDTYFGSCSLLLSCDDLSVAAATLANGGLCPTTGERVFTADQVRNALSVLMQCGMYDRAGRFFFEIGMPAKSGVSGLVMVIVPNRCGFATFSPRLDDAGNSVRGVAFFRALVEQFTVHVLDNHSAGTNGFKFDLGVPVRSQPSSPAETLGWAASLGEPSALGFQRIFLKVSVGVAKSLRLPEDVAARQIQDSYYHLMGGLRLQSEIRELLASAPDDALIRLPEELKRSKLIFTKDVTNALVKGLGQLVAMGDLPDQELQLQLLPLLLDIGVSESIGRLVLRDWKHLKPDTVKVIPDAEQATFVVPEAQPLPVLNEEMAKTVLRQVWQVARVDPPKFARLAYSQLFWEDAAIASLFRGTVMEEQGQRLVDMVGQAIDLLDERETLSSALDSLGAMHAQMGVLEEHFPAVGRAVRWAMKTATGDVRWSPEADAAWHWFYDIVSTGMIEGARKRDNI